MLADPVADFIVVALLGAMVGVGELVSRYRTSPGRALWTQPALLYLALNAAAAAVALAVVRTFGWTFGVSAGPGNESGSRLTQLLVAGFGAVALFRTSLQFVGAGEQRAELGLSRFLESVLGAADREVDRLEGQARATTVAAIMEGVSFVKAHEALPAFCLALMQSLPEEDQQDLGRQVAVLRDADIDEGIKTLLLGLNLMNVVGEGVLKAAVHSLDERIRESP